MGAGYTRQSAAAIEDGETINAVDHNKEYNQLQNAFSGTTGHAHDGTTGNGPKISLTSSVSGILPVANGGSGGIYKIDATTAPSATDDANDGYTEGSIWIDVTNDKFYICIDATAGMAIWRNFVPYDAGLESIASLTTAANKMIYTTALDTYAVTDLTSFARSILDDADASTALSTLGFSTYIKTLVDDADASAARSTLGLGSISTQNSSSVNITGGTLAGIGITSLTTPLSAADGGTGVNSLSNLKSAMSLENVNNTSDANKPVSTATQTALDLKAPLSSPALTGTPTAPTATSGTNTTQIATTAFVSTAITNYVPVPSGAVLPFAMSSAPTGWLKCDGTAVSRTTYSGLFSAIGTTFGSGNGSTTFNLPDLRGEFIRGLDDSRGIDSGRVLGSSQSSQNLAHTHTASTSSSGDHTHTYTEGYVSGVQNGQLTGSPGYYNNRTSNTSSSGAHTHTVTVGSDGGTEARPRNIALLYCIKV